MGTNYYAVYDKCGSCDRHERLHICKSLITFRGHFNQTWDPEALEYRETPWLVSWQDWKEFLLNDNVEYVIDEYGSTHETVDFVSLVEATIPKARRRQYDWVLTHDPESRTFGVAIRGEWLDADGFSFYGGEFS